MPSFKEIKRYSLTICITAIISVTYGQYWQPNPLFLPTALPNAKGDALPNMDFDDDFGYTQDFRDNMDKLIASSVKPKRG